MFILLNSYKIRFRTHGIYSIVTNGHVRGTELIADGKSFTLIPLDDTKFDSLYSTQNKFHFSLWIRKEFIYPPIILYMSFGVTSHIH